MPFATEGCSLAHRAPVHLEGFPRQLLGLVQVALVMSDVGEVVERQRDVRVVVAQELALHFERLAVQGFGLVILALLLQQRAPRC